MFANRGRTGGTNLAVVGERQGSGEQRVPGEHANLDGVPGAQHLEQEPEQLHLVRRRRHGSPAGRLSPWGKNVKHLLCKKRSEARQRTHGRSGWRNRGRRDSHGVGGGGEAELPQAVGLAREHGGFQNVLEGGDRWGTNERERDQMR